MKVVILCGGLGTRLREETEFRPKPMVPIGEYPILWHIMKHYAFYGHNEFFLALGYKGNTIKQYFHEYHAMSQNVTLNLGSGMIVNHGGKVDDWIVHLIDTGRETNTGGRVLRLREHLGEEAFLLSYGDNVSDVNLDSLVAQHRADKSLVTLTAVHPPPRFGFVSLTGQRVDTFSEKGIRSEDWANGGYMVVEPGFFGYLKDDRSGLEVLEQVAQDGLLSAYRHEGYWQCMDTLRDKERLEKEWSRGAPWKIWD